MNDIPPKSPSSNAEPLRLHIPEHHGTPGGHADFSYFRLPPAGGVARPPIDCPARDTHPLANELIRVLDDDGDGGRRVGPQARPRDAAPRPARDDADPRL